MEELKSKLLVIEDIKKAIDKHKLNPTFNDKFEVSFLKREYQREIAKDLLNNIVM